MGILQSAFKSFCSRGLIACREYTEIIIWFLQGLTSSGQRSLLSKEKPPSSQALRVVWHIWEQGQQLHLLICGSHSPGRVTRLIWLDKEREKEWEYENQQVVKGSEEETIPGCVLDHPQRKEDYCIFACLGLLVTSLLTRRLSCSSG